MHYDFLVVGAGLWGAVFAHEARKAGKRVLVIDKRSHTGGNVYCENIAGITVHKYGPHIFHTNDKEIWEYVTSLANFNRYTHAPVANFNGQFNMNTFYQLWGVKTPAEAQQWIEKEREGFKCDSPRNLEDQAISMVGREIYTKLIKGYTEKQWGRAASELPASVIKRIPLRFTFDNNYFDDCYQGVPIGGYNTLIAALLKSVEVKLNVDFLNNQADLRNMAKSIVYTGPIDAYFDFIHGELEYRTLSFLTQTLTIPNFQGNATVNYTDRNPEYTRIIEHKHFEFGKQDHTVITYEYPAEWKKGNEPYYPINNNRNQTIYGKYKVLAENESNTIFGGRLAEYRYYDMHQVIASALKKCRVMFGV
jgi:UDP-galactopyranose mutase